MYDDVFSVCLQLLSAEVYLSRPKVTHQKTGLLKFKSMISKADNLTVAHRLPAVNYGGVVEKAHAAAEGQCQKPLLHRFRHHTGKLYWHVVAAQPDYILSVNTTSAWPQPPRRMADFFHPDFLRLNHYIDALGPRASPETFKHQDAPKVLGWATNLSSSDVSLEKDSEFQSLVVVDFQWWP